MFRLSSGVARMHDFRDFGGLRHEVIHSWFNGRLIPKSEKIMHRDRTLGMAELFDFRLG